jgi:hypothetical protein
MRRTSRKDHTADRPEQSREELRLGTFYSPFIRVLGAPTSNEVSEVAMAMVIFGAFCILGIVFLLSFFVALCREGKRPHYIVQAQHQLEIGVSSVGKIENVRAEARTA